MTHDELLARIAKLSITPETNVVPSELATALMAVVELHKPKDGNYGCPECGLWEFDENGKLKTCQTIQTIEKELG